MGHNINKLTTNSVNKIRIIYQKIIQDSYILGKEYNSKLGKSTVLTFNDIEEIHTLTKSALKKLFAILNFEGKIKEDYYDIFSEIDYFDFEGMDDEELDNLSLEFPELEDELDYDLLDEIYNDALISGDSDTSNTIQQFKLNPSMVDMNTKISGSYITLMITGPKGFHKEITIPTSRVDNITNDITIKSLNKGTLSNSSNIIQFVTRRDKSVCPICEDLDMEQFDIDPITRMIDGPTIPDDTHPNCRCRYMSLDEDKELLVG